MVVYSQADRNYSGTGIFFSSIDGAISINKWTEVARKSLLLAGQDVVITNYIQMEHGDWINCVRDQEKKNKE
jgi:hypothetical protein